MRCFNPRGIVAATRIRHILLIALFSSTTVFAQSQSNAGDITGVIADPNGAVVANAAVTARNPEYGISRTLNSNEAGEYRIVNLPPGIYEITIEAANFKRAVVPDARITVGEAATLNITLEVGGVGETVTVDNSNVEIVETTRTAVTNTIDQQRIENLPINQRDYLGFTLTSSNVGRDNSRPIGPAPTSGLNVGGQRGRSSLVQVDGADNTDNSINAARSTVSQEAVQEFQVVTNSFAPEFGRSAGGVVNVVTKRGTNDFTGNVFGFLRDRSIQARAPLAGFKTAFTRGQYGGTLGGRLVRDRTFFFAAFERRTRNESGLFTSDVIGDLTAATTIPVISFPGLNLNPSARTFTRITPGQAAYINGTINQGLTLLANPATITQGVGAICAARSYAFLTASGGNTGLSGTNPLSSPNDGSLCNTVAPPISPILPGQTVGSRFFLTGAPVPVGTRDANGNPIAFRPLLDLQQVFPVTDRTNFFSFRLDQNINASNQFNVRFGYNPSRITGIQVESQNQSLGQNDFSRTGISDFKDTSVIANLTSTYGSIVNEGRFNFGRREAAFLSQNGESVAFNITGASFIGRELFSPVDRVENRFQFADNLTYATGDHTFKFGADINFVDIPSALFELDFAGLFNFGPTPASQLGFTTDAPTLTPVQSYGLGLPQTFIQGFSNSRSTFKNRPLAFFAQDSWRVLQNVTLNYGVRYDIELTPVLPPTAFRDPLTGIALTEADVAAAENAVGVLQGIPRDKNNVAPRLAVAWDIFNDGGTVLRAAYGLFYDHPPLTIGFNADIVDATQQQQSILTAGSPAPNALLNASQVFQGTVCVAGNNNPLCPPGFTTPGVAPSAVYQFGRQRFDPANFIGYTSVLPFTLPLAADYQYAQATQGNLSVERRLDRNTSISLQYQNVRARFLNRPADLNPVQSDLLIENFRRATATAADPAGRLPINTTEANALSVPTQSGNGFTVVIPGVIAVNNATGLRFINPGIANFFRPNAPNYFLAAFVSGGQISKAVLDSQLAGTLRTPGPISPFGGVTAQTSDGNSEYNALTVDLRRRFADSLTLLGSYTWSHSIDDSSDLQTLLAPQDPFDRRAERADSLFDQRHRFVFSGVLASPAGFRSSDNLFQRFLADFTVAPIIEISSGRPFNILTNFDANADQSNQTDRPDVQPDGSLCVPDRPATGAGSVPVDAPCSLFDVRDGRVFFAAGNLGRNRGLTRSFANVDLRVARAIRFGERVRLDVIAEGFNLFNRFNEASVSPFLGDVLTVNERASGGRYRGRTTATFDQRQFQFALKLNF